MGWEIVTRGPGAPADLALGWLIHSTVLLAAGLLAGRALRRRGGAAVLSAVYRTTLVAVLLCPAAPVLLALAGYQGITIRLPDRGTSETVTLETPAPREVANTGRAGADGALRLARATTEASAVSGTSPDRTVRPRWIPTTPEPAPAPPQGVDRATIASTGLRLGLGVWLAVSAVLVARLVVGQARMVRLRASAVPAGPVAEGLCRELALKLRVRPPALLRTPFLHSPCLDGLWRPTILLPEEDAEGDLREALVHELAHLARRDPLWNLIRRSSTALLWIQPLLWTLSRRMEATAEEVCDDVVVQSGADRTRYAGLLLDLAERTLPPVAPSGVGMIALRSMLAVRVRRILDPSRALSTRAGAKAMAATLLAGLLGTFTAGLLGFGAAAPASAEEKAPKTPKEASGKSRTVRSRVVDPSGKPVAGAVVTASRYRPTWVGSIGWDWGHERQELARTVTDAEGQFSLTFEPPDPGSTEKPQSPDRWWSTAITASARGFGPTTVGPDGPKDGQALTLVGDDVPVGARVVDLEGKPVAGVSVRIHQLYPPPPAPDFDRWIKVLEGKAQGLKAMPVSNYFPNPSDTVLRRGDPALPGPVTTDADGRFRLEGLGRDRLAILEISGPTVALRRVNMITRRMGRVEGPSRRGPSIQDPAYYGSESTIVVPPGRVLDGVVRDLARKVPIPGVIVTAEKLAGSPSNIEGSISAVTDAEGRYRLVGLPKASGHTLAVYPPLDQPYFITDGLKVDDGPGLTTLWFEIELKRGIWITGKVADSRTGTPVRAAIHYYPFLDNDRARAYRNFDANQVSFEWTGERYRTDAEGNFRVVALPGRGVVAARCFDLGYRQGVGADAIKGRNEYGALLTYNEARPDGLNVLKEVNPPERAESARYDLAPDPGASLTIRLVDESGAPVEGAAAWGRFPEVSGLVGDKTLGRETRASVGGIDPGKPRTVVFGQWARKIGAVVVVRDTDPDIGRERTVVLRPSATVVGRLVDAEGKPASGGVDVRLVREGEHPLSAMHIAGVPLDDQGRFRAEGLPPGGTFVAMAKSSLIHSYPPISPEKFRPFELSEKGFTAETGQEVDLGTFDVSTGRRAGAPAPKAAEPKKAEARVRPDAVPIVGKVVDPDGKPVVGTTVTVEWIQRAKSGDLSPWLEAARQGKPDWHADVRGALKSDARPEGLPRTVSTDDEGRFRLEGIGPDRVVGLKLQGPTVALAELTVVTRTIEPIPAPGFLSRFGPKPTTIYGSEATITARRDRPVEGVVRVAKTGRALAGVAVLSEAFAGSSFGGGVSGLRATTDAQGRFRLDGMPKGVGNRITVRPGDELPIFSRVVDLPDPPGTGPLTLDIELHQGLWITGRVTDKITGRPIEAARLYYLPFLENTYARALPEFAGGSFHGDPRQDRYQTKADGTFRLAGLAGRAIVGVDHGMLSFRTGVGAESIKGMDKDGHFPTWNNPINAGRSWPFAMKEIDPTSPSEEVRLDLEMDPGRSFRVRVVDPKGVPVEGVKVDGRTSVHYLESIADSEFSVTQLGPDEARWVLIRHDGRALGKLAEVRPRSDTNEPIVVTLEPLATIVGRLVDGDGKPVANVSIRTNVSPIVDFGLHLPLVTSDQDGRFRVEGVPVGRDYVLIADRNVSGSFTQIASAEASVRPGETIDVGTLQFR